jgi:hypothetical protein
MSGLAVARRLLPALGRPFRLPNAPDQRTARDPHTARDQPTAPDQPSAPDQLAVALGTAAADGPEPAAGRGNDVPEKDRDRQLTRRTEGKIV